MALSIIEQLELTKGEVKPPNHLLIDLVHHTATVFSKSFNYNYKEFDGETNVLAETYKRKILELSNKVFRQDMNTIKSLVRVVIVIIGDSSFTLTQVSNADDDAWAAFILDQMDEAFELVSGVKKEEKEEYKALP